MGRNAGESKTRILWYREVSHAEPPAWLVTGRMRDVVAFGSTHAFLLPGGAYLTKKGDHEFHLPIAAVDLGNGLGNSMVVSVPFEGDVPAPTSNFSQSFAPDGRETYRTSGSRHVAITWLEAEDSILRVTLAAESYLHTLTFDLQDHLDTSGAGRRPREDDWIAKAKARVAKVDQAALDGALHEYEAGDSVHYLRALLEAGANPNTVRDGKSILARQAVYGTAAAVEILIEAGADIHAISQDRNRWSVLHWAAVGDPGTKRKLQALIGAGADPNTIDDDGETILMLTARDGQIPATEYLIGIGLDVTARTKNGRRLS